MITTDFDLCVHNHCRLLSYELGSAQTRAASPGLGHAFQNPAKPLEAVRQDRGWAEPSSRANSPGPS